MDFFKLIQSLDELLFEVLSWLLFYPVTLWRVIVHPVRTLRYAEDELQEEPDEQFSDSLSPPLFLLITLVLIHLAELSWIGQSDLVADRVGLHALVSSDTNVIVLRSMIFGLFPLLLARRYVKARGERVDRKTIKTPFYAQCFATAPFAILISASSLLARKFAEAALWPVVICFVGGLLWFGLIQVEWFRTRLKVSRWAAFRHSSVVMAQGVFALLFVGWALD